MPLLNIENINQNIRRLEYAVRGPLVARADELALELKSGSNKPFPSIIRANIGDCHATGQQPLTYYRQMLACVTHPTLIDDVSANMPQDVKRKARELLGACGGQSVGAYSHACGFELIRRHCATYIKNRDNVATEWENIFLTTGASEVVKTILAFINHSDDGKLPVGVMIPIPQYPLYSATLCELGMHQINYYLNEDNDWSLDIDELDRAHKEAQKSCNPRAIVVINPGNPTGAVLTRENIFQVIKFAQKHNLMIIADEVYQHNIWEEGAQFHSFRNCMDKLNGNVELVSMMSSSKGYMGECGLRGGYGELHNFTPEVRAIFYKFLSARLCSSTVGQVSISCVVNPPQPGDESYELFQKEKSQILNSLKAKAKFVAETFNSIDGITCNKVAGAMYAFPKLSLPDKAIAAAQDAGQAPDFFYLKALLEETGICVVPGSGFGQKPRTFHFRTTILPQTEVFNDMMSRFVEFHRRFIANYS